MTIQPKLTINAPGDIHEQEADRIAEQVMRMPEPAVPAANAHGSVVQRTAAQQAGPATVPPIVHDVLGSPGEPLDAATRAFMEPRFGHDFGKVRVHADAKAAKAASSIDARAFASNRDIVFGTGEYMPQTESGRRLVAHELTHVAQQGAGAELAIGVGAVGHTDGLAQVRGEAMDAVIQRQEAGHWSGQLPAAPARSPEGVAVNTPALRTRIKPLDGAQSIVDLTKVIGVESELTKTTAKWLLVEVKGARWYIEVGEQRMAALLQDLETQILKDGKARPTFESTTFFDLDNNTLTFGAAGTETSLAVDVKEAGDVLKESNARTEDAAWSFLNAGQPALHKEDVKTGERAGPQEKPGAWYNYYYIDKGEVKVHLSSNDPRSKAAEGKNYRPPTMDLGAYRKMLQQDFEFSGVISKCIAAGGEKTFIDAILARYPHGNPNVGNSAENLAALAREIWSYATTGADTAGNTDIAEMQGLLFALDARIQESSGTNTPMSGGTFALRGTGVALQRGDGRHGRATVLATRHLLANIQVTTRSPGRLETREETEEHEQTFGKQDRFIKDVSGSAAAKTQVIDSEMKKAMGWSRNDPRIHQTLDATMTEMGVTVKRAGRITRRALLVSRRRYADVSGKPWGDVLKDAYRYLYPLKTKDNAEKFASLLDLPLAEAFDLQATGGNGPYEVDGARIMQALGEAKTSYGSQGESGLKAIIETLLYSRTYTDAKLRQLDESGGRPRINVVMDEHEQALEYLGLAQELARTKGITVRLFALPTKKEDVTMNKIRIIDLESIKITMNAAPQKIGNEPDYVVGTLTFDAVQNGIALHGDTAIIIKAGEFLPKKKLEGARGVLQQDQFRTGADH